MRLPTRTKARLLEMFVLGVRVFRQRCEAPASATSMERFYRLCRACCAWEEQLQEPFDGALERDETTLGRARHGKHGWGAAGKVIVFGGIQRNGHVKATPIAAHNQLEVMRETQATRARARCTTQKRYAMNWLYP